MSITRPVAAPASAAGLAGLMATAGLVRVLTMVAMHRPKHLTHCKRRAIPRGLKIKILLRQEGRCADCGIPMIAECVFDHRPPLALRDVGDNPNDPNRLAAICHPCNKRKTVRDLRAIARARRLA